MPCGKSQDMRAVDLGSTGLRTLISGTYALQIRLTGWGVRRGWALIGLTIATRLGNWCRSCEARSEKRGNKSYTGELERHGDGMKWLVDAFRKIEMDSWVVVEMG